MEKALARVKFEGLGEEDGEGTSASEMGSEGEDSDEREEEEERREARLLVTQQNRKGKKSGGFQSMGLSLPVFKGIMRKGYRVPTPIQRKCIPLIMDGKDVVAMARTGSGKTAAFLLPMFERLKAHSAKIGARALILSPTRELATQTMKFTKELGKFTDLRTTLLLGGDKLEDQFARMHENPDIIIATPGRLLHLLVEMGMKLSSMEYVVFDEADRLFEMGFAEQLREIIHGLPEARQTLLFSATLPKLLVQFAKAGLQDPVLVRLDVDSKLSSQLKMAFLAARSEVKSAVLLSLLRSVVPSEEQTVVFAPTKHHVEYLKELLIAAGLKVTYVYSSLDQTARKINVAKFLNKKAMVMVVTDVAARGIDIPMLDNVINYNFPDKAKLFVHRVGRVARAGRSGSAYSLVSPDELSYLIDLHLFISQPVILAKPGMAEGTSGVFGSIPQSIVDEEEDLVRHLHNQNSDLPALLQVAQSAQKQFLRSRGPSAPESIKRAKQLPTSINPHPVFSSLGANEEAERTKLLQRLHGYRPHATILEIHSTNKAAGKTIMAGKRKCHGGVVSAQKQKGALDVYSEQEPSVAQVEATEKDLTSFHTPSTAANKSKMKDNDNYIPHLPSDFQSEKGLSVGSSFDSQAASATLDLEGDEGESFNRSRNQLKWDRKRKRFVGETGREANMKKIKTESGQRIPASYKSQAYKRWREKHKIEVVLAGEEEGDAAVGSGAPTTNRWRGKGRGRGRGRGGRGGGGMERGEEGRRRTVGDLKTKDEILRKRKRKDFQQTRRKLKQKVTNPSDRMRGRGKRGRG